MSNQEQRLTTPSSVVDLKEAWATFSRVRAAYHPGSQAYPFSPGERMYSDIAGRHRDIQVVSSLCLYVHVATKYLWAIRYISNYLVMIFMFKTGLIFSISEPSTCV